MLSLWIDTSMLTLESYRVVSLRLAKIALGGKQSSDEIALMVNEKIAATTEAMAGIMTGKTTADTLNRYRDHVAANHLRLSSPF